MKNNLNIVSPLHKKTKRDCLSRMKDSKVFYMKLAKKYSRDYWDGSRKAGYGGYKYIKDYWKPVALKLIKKYKLTNSSSVLDVGCGKGFLLFEIKKVLPNIHICGFDLSKYAILRSPKDIKKNLFVHDAKKKFPLKNKNFDLVISLACVHNLNVYELKNCLKEISRVGKKQYIMTESYRNDQELFNLQCWALTCDTFFSPKEWKWIFKESGYTGDYEFIYF